MIKQVENPIVELHDLTVAYHKRPVLWGIDLSLPQGVLVGIIGPNGAGKTTLIKTIMGLVSSSSGYIKLFNKYLDEVRKLVSYVPQKESVDWDFPTSVLDVVMMGRYTQRGLFKRLRKEDKEAAMACLGKVGMTQYAQRQIGQLSGGQQQRVFLARALAQEAQLYFMDEPFAGIDMATEKAIISLLKEMSQKGKTVVVVHHDLQSVTEYFDWVVLLNMRMVAAGPTQEVFTPELLQETYGSKLTVLRKVGDLIKKKELPVRET